MDSRSPAVFITTLTLGISATAFVAFRVISKLWVVKRFTSDDYLVLVAWVFATGVSAAVCYGAKEGLGEHDGFIQQEGREPMRRAIYAFTILYNPALMATKTSILILYIRMAAAHPFLRYASIAVAGIVNIAGIVLTFLSAFQCRPIAAAFRDEIDGTCIDVVSMYLASAPINILTDLAILCLPLPILTQLRMEYKQKLALVCTFIVGGFVAIVDVVRILYLQNALRATREAAVSLESSRPADFFYHASFSLMWSAVEVSVGLMCCCVLVLKPLVMRVLPGFLGRERRSSRMTAGESCQDKTMLSAANERPSSVEHPAASIAETEEDDGMDFFQMLASDPTQQPSTPLPPIAPTRTRRLSTSFARRLTITQRPVAETNQEASSSFLDFVNMKGRTPLTELTAKEAWWPIMFVSSLFFLWGFAYGLLGTLNGQVQSLLNYPPSRTFALHNAYWIGYFLGPPLVGYWTLTREGFKATFIAGLAIYSCGAMSFWPSSVLQSYPGFFISNLIVALGLSVLENAANPFVALAGPGHLSESRLCFSQGIQGIGSVISPLIARRALFSGLDENDLFRVQYCYLAVALFVVALAVVFFYVPLSEVSDDELEAMATQRLYNVNLEKGEKAYKVDARKLLLVSGIIMMATYVGAQESVSYFWYTVSSSAYPSFDPGNSSAIASSLFAIGRFIASALTYFFPPRLVLFGYIFGSFITSLLGMVLPPGPAAMTFLILLQFFESAIFPILFAMILRGQGKHTKLAATGTTMAIIGGSIWPSVVYAVDGNHPENPRYSIRVTTSLYAVAMLWPIALSVNRVMRRWLDPAASKRRVGIGDSVDGTLGGPEVHIEDFATPRSTYGKSMTTHLEIAVEEEENDLGSNEENHKSGKQSGETLVN